MGLAPLRRQHHAVHGQRRVGLQAAASAATARPACYDDLEQADCVVLVGANIADNHPLLAPRVLDEPTSARHVIVVDPRVTKTAMVADVHLAVRPRTDITLLNGDHPHVLIDEDLVDHDYIADHTDRLRRAAPPTCEPYTLERVADECGHRRPTPSATSPCAFGTAERAFVAWTMGVNHSVQGTETVTLLNTLCLLTGNIGRAGAGAVLDHRPVQRHGHPRDGVHRVDARLPRLRRPGGPARAGRSCWAWTSPGCPPSAGRAYPDIINGDRRRADQGAVGHRHEPGRVVPQPRGARGRARAASSCSSCRTASRRRPPRWPTSCCRPRSGARRTARSPTPSGACRACAQAVDAAGRGADRLRHLPRARRSPRAARRAVPGLDGARGRVRGVAPRVRRPAVRLQRHHLGRASTTPAACSGRARRRDGTPRSAGRAAALHRRRGSRPPDGRAPAARASSPSRSRDRPPPRLPVAAQHRADGRALAHPHQDRPGADPRAPGARRRGSRCIPTTPRALRPALRRRACGVVVAAGRDRADRGAGDLDRAAGEVFVPFHYDERAPTA